MASGPSVPSQAGSPVEISSGEIRIANSLSEIARVAELVGEAGGNILEVSHNRMMTGISAKAATLVLVVEARDAEHGAEIREKLKGSGFTPV